MAEPKVLNTRIQLRFDTLENWEAAVKAKPKAIILEKGEVAIAQINKVMPPPPNIKEVSTKSTTVEYMMKVGDGTTSFEDLPWFSAKAADVYDWAKQENLLVAYAQYMNTDEADGQYTRTINSNERGLICERMKFDEHIPTSIPKESPYRKNAPTTAAVKEYVDKLVAGAVQYWGVVNKAEDLGKDMTSNQSPKPVVSVGKGDFYRVGSAFSTYKIGDLLVANIDNAGSELNNYSRIIQEDYKGTVTSITAGTGLLGGTITSSGTISHDIPSGASAGKKGTGTPSDRKYLKSVTTDKFGHVTGFTEGTETVTDTKHNHGAGVGLSVNSTAYTGTITYSLKTSTTEEIGGGKVVKVHSSAVTTVTPTQSASTTQNYGVEIDSNGKYFVHVPWTDTQGEKPKDGKLSLLPATNSPIIVSTGDAPFSANAGHDTEYNFNLSYNDIHFKVVNKKLNLQDTVLMGRGNNLADASSETMICLCGGSATINI